MATLAYVKAGTSGTTVPLAAASVGGDKVAPNSHGALLVRNGSGGSINVTLVVPGNTRRGQAEPDVVVAVAAGATRMIGPLDGDLADRATDSLVAFTYSAVTDVTVAAIEI